jgi:hypothetical protein
MRVLTASARNYIALHGGELRWINHLGLEDVAPQTSRFPDRGCQGCRLFSGHLTQHGPLDYFLQTKKRASFA